MALEIGSRLTNYEIVELIGVGGMGEVYRARDPKLGRDVAIKILPEEFARDPERLARFEREAKLLASVNHPGIATSRSRRTSESRSSISVWLKRGRRKGPGPTPPSHRR